MGFISFSTSVAIERYHEEQLYSYLPGENIPFIPCIIIGRTKDNKILARDFSGGLVKTDRNIEDIPLNSYAVIQGKLGQNREFLVNDIRLKSDLNLKIWCSLLVLIFISWKLIGNLKLTPKGLVLLSPEEKN